MTKSIFFSFAYMVNKHLQAECICEVNNCPEELPVPSREDFDNPLVRRAARYMDLINDPVHPESEGLICVVSDVKMVNPDNVRMKRISYNNLLELIINHID